MSRRSPFSGSSSPTPNAVELAALDWLTRLDRGITPDEERKFERWLAADPRHAEAFAEFGGTWSFLDRVVETPAAVAAKISGEIDPDAFAPAASVAAESLGNPTPSGSKDNRSQRWKKPSWVLAGLGLAAALAIVSTGERQSRPETQNYAERVVTELGGLQRVNLPDGSVVQLNTGSELEVQFTPSVRRVYLSKGEAHFSIAKNPARPFVVSALGMEVQAVGTAFNVRLNSESLDVLVTEGQVRLQAETSETVGPAALGTHLLSAGEKVSVGRDQLGVAAVEPVRPVQVKPAEIERRLAWQERRLEFADASLAEMVAEFNRFHHVKLVIADAGLAAQRFGGIFNPEDIAGFVRVLEKNFGVVVERGETVTTLRSAREP